MKKLLTLIITASLMLSSCGIIVINKDKGADTSDQTSTGPSNIGGVITATPTEDADDGYDAAMDKLAQLTVTSMESGEFVLACCDPTFYTGNGEELQINADRIAREDMIEKKMSCTVRTKQVDPGELVSSMSEALKSGTMFADAVAAPLELMGALTANGLLTDLSAVTDLDLTASYFDTASKEAFTLNGKTYGICGDACFEPEKTECLLYNKTLADSLGLEDIGKLVSSGQWTLDKYFQALQAVTDDNTVKHNYLSDYTDSFLHGSGMKYGAVKDGRPSLGTFSDTFSSAAQKIAEIFNTYPTSKVEREFSNKNVLFTSRMLSEISKYKDSDFVWNIAPYPKADAQSEYTSYASKDSTVFCIPEKAYSPSLSADFIECLNAASEDYFVNRYISYQANYVLRTEDSVYALCKILDSKSYDFAVYAKSGYEELSQYTDDVYKKMLEGSMTADELDRVEKLASSYMESVFPTSAG